MDLVALLKDLQEGESWTSLVITWGMRLAGAVLVFYIGLRIARWIAGLAERSLSRAHVEATATLFLRNVAYVVLLVILVLAVLQVFIGVQMASMFAVLGVAGLAIALALKNSLSNIASGVMLVTLRPFRVGDIVGIAGMNGTVEAVSIFQTRLRGVDNQTIILPNSLITNAPIINLTPDTMRRIALVIGIGYNGDIDAARAAALEVMHADPRILADPAPSVAVYELAGNTVKLGIHCHVGNADHFATQCDLNERIKQAFDRASIPRP